ncbi:MAG: gas vesicle protein GvpD P-loop domain-containing protein, partial [Thermoplasmata archaeon]
MNGININYRFPYELLQFILSKSGNSLLIKGPPGGGKTTISLQILETLQGKGNIVYLSTRVGDTSLYQQFPWLKDLEKNLKIIIASKIILESISEVEEEEKEIVQYGKKFLQEITGEGPKNVSRVEYKKILKDKKAPEIKR